MLRLQAGCISAGTFHFSAGIRCEEKVGAREYLMFVVKEGSRINLERA